MYQVLKFSEYLRDIYGKNGIIFYFCWTDDPSSDPNATGDPYKTLFVARLVSEDLFRSFLLL